MFPGWSSFTLTLINTTGLAYAVNLLHSPTLFWKTTHLNAQTEIIAVQRVYYNQSYNFGCRHLDALLDLGLTQFSSSPMDDRHVNPAHRVLDWWRQPSILGWSTVYEYVLVISPSFLLDPDVETQVWPSNLVTCALFNTLHSKNYAGIGDYRGMDRERFFFYCFIGSVCYCAFLLLFLSLSLFTEKS